MPGDADTKMIGEVSAFARKGNGAMTASGSQLSVIGNVPEGMQPFTIARLVERALEEGTSGPAALVFVARDGRRMQRLVDVLPSLLPGHPILSLPAWDCPAL